MKDLKNFLIKREQSQARLRFAKCEKSRLLARTLLTLVALFAMTTGAWADNTETVNITAATVNGTNVTVTATFYNSDTGAWMSYKGETIVVTSKDGSNFEQLVLNIKNNEINAGDVKASAGTCTVDGKKITVTGINASSVTFSNDDSSISISSVEVTFAAPTGTPVPLTWTEATKTATLTNGMPAGNVTVSVDYFPQAEFDKSNDATPVALAPAAIANVPANTDAPIVTAGTVANIGTTDVKQGTLKYLVIQPTDDTVPTAPDYDDERWTDKVPTANELKQGDVYVWYYIEGAEPATIAERTDDNTRSDSDIKPLGANGIVTLLPEPTYDVTLNAEGLSDEEAAAWKVAKGTDDPAAFPLEGVKKSETVTVTYSGQRKIIGVKAEKAKEPVTLATPLTIEAVTDGIIEVTFSAPTSNKCHGMKYSVNGGTKTTITTTETIEGLKAGDKVQFYGIGTSNTSYGFSPEVKISGGTAKTKVYGNIMSLLYETGFATMTDLPNDQYVFFGLFRYNTTLIDASELLLPAATLTDYCYQRMFEGCTNLTTAPKLPAETLADACYEGMFEGCESLTTAYVKAAYTEVAGSCTDMFKYCSATGAVLHTTHGYSKDEWEDKMGPDKTWSNWTVADDWQD